MGPGAWFTIQSARLRALLSKARVCKSQDCQDSNPGLVVEKRFPLAMQPVLMISTDGSVLKAKPCEAKQPLLNISTEPLKASKKHVFIFFIVFGGKLIGVVVCICANRLVLV